MTTIKSRVERLEKKTGRRCYMVMAYEGETDDEALARAGVKPDANDSVFWIQHFCTRPEEVAGTGAGALSFRERGATDDR